jgi:YgiT-type zinc finger domain-containing protein
MAGDSGKKQVPDSSCPLCGGTMKEGTAPLPFLIGERLVVVRDVPAEICSDCGEPFMKSRVAGRIEALLDRLEELDSEMSVVHYKAA